MTTDLYSVADLTSWNGTGTARLMNTITITSSDAGSFPLDIGHTTNTTLFNGQRNIIEIDNTVTNFLGLFRPISNAALITVEKLAVQYIRSPNTGSPLATLDNNAGSIIASTPSIGGYSLKVVNCAAIGASDGTDFNISTDGGGIVGGSNGNTGADIEIEGCYCNGNVSGDGAGGIAGFQTGISGTVLIHHCYSTGDITGASAGGIAGERFGFNATSAIVRNCYATGEVNGGGNNTYAGGVLGADIGANATVDMTNCYFSGSITTGGSLGGTLPNTATLNIDHCYSLNGTNSNFVTQTFPPAVLNVTNSGGGNGTWGATLGIELLDSGAEYVGTWDDSDVNNPFLLTHFQNTPWNGSTYASADDGMVSFAFGDPHMNPLNGPRYFFEHLGPYRHFDNHHHNRMIVNGCIRKGDYAHRHLDYLREVYVAYGGGYIHIDLGFRGQMARVLGHKGIKYEVQTLPISRRTVRRCQLRWCKYRTEDATDISHNEKWREYHPTMHYVPPAVRNRITFSVKVAGDNIYHFEIENVNFMDCSPCLFLMRIEDASRVDCYSGAGVLPGTSHDYGLTHMEQWVD